jgi:hypothetical protein
MGVIHNHLDREPVPLVMNLHVKISRMETDLLHKM